MDIRYIWGRFFKKLHGSSIKNSTIHKYSKINAGSQVVDTNVARYSFCGYDCQFINCSIGAFCSISSQVIAGGHSHPIDWASMSPVFYAGRDSISVKFAKHNFHESHPLARTTIGSDVWIGSNVIIKAGVTIGNGAIVGMGSVIVKDVPDYAIVAGNPAKLIRMRFDSETVDKLLKTRWWDLPDKEIMRLAPHVTDVDKFLLYAETFVFSQNYYLANKKPLS